MSIRRLTFLLMLPLLAGIAPAAAQDDYALFRNQAKGASLLYRGHQAYEYALVYNGTYYWTSPEFRTGEVRYNGNTYRNVPLNIDAARQDLLVRTPDGVSEKVLESQFVEDCTFGGSHYQNLRVLYGADAPEGYWQVLYDKGRARLFCQVRKNLEQDVENRKSAMTHYEGVFRPNVYQVFTYEASYLYVTEEGRFVRIRRRKDLLRELDPSLRREIRRHVRHLDDSSYMPLDRFCTEALKYVESR